MKIAAKMVDGRDITFTHEDAGKIKLVAENGAEYFVYRSIFHLPTEDVIADVDAELCDLNKEHGVKFRLAESLAYLEGAGVDIFTLVHE